MISIVVAPERRVSVEDGEMRHGRKSKSKRFNGFKRHIASDLDTGLILACVVTPANRPEEEAAPVLRDDLARLPGRNQIGSLHIDRGDIASDVVSEVIKRRGLVLCKPWVARNGKLFSKSDFVIDMRRKSIQCPAGARSSTSSPGGSLSSIRRPSAFWSNRWTIVASPTYATNACEDRGAESRSCGRASTKCLGQPLICGGRAATAPACMDCAPLPTRVGTTRDSMHDAFAHAEKIRSETAPSASRASPALH